MLSKLKRFKSIKHYAKLIAISPLFISSLYPNIQNSAKAGFEVQWDGNDNFKKLRWYQTEDRKSARNKIFLFLTSSDRKTGLLKVNIKVPDGFISKIKEKKVSFCKVKVGGFYEKTRCLENIPVEIELDKKNKSLDIFPESPIPSDKNNYAIVLKVTNPNRGGLYQFHSFGQSSGNVPVSFYLGSWTLKMQSI